MAGTLCYRAEHDGSWQMRGSRLRPNVHAIVKRDHATGDAIAIIGMTEVARVPRGSFRDAARELEAILLERGDMTRNGKWKATS